MDWEADMYIFLFMVLISVIDMLLDGIPLFQIAASFLALLFLFSSLTMELVLQVLCKILDPDYKRGKEVLQREEAQKASEVKQPASAEGLRKELTRKEEPEKKQTLQDQASKKLSSMVSL